MIAAAEAADADGWDGVWTYDHFSALVATGIGPRGWSRDPFVALGAIAARTQRLRLGVLVANIANRHPAQLASALNTLQALAPGRVVCGIGAGAGPGTQFAAEANAIGRTTLPVTARRALLVEYVAALRSIWRDEDADGVTIRTHGLTGVVDGAAQPPIVIGAGTDATIRLAAEHADGVNLVGGAGPRLAEQVALARTHAAAPGSERDSDSESQRAQEDRGRGFEVSVHAPFEVDHPGGGDLAPLLAAGVDRRTLWVTAPYPVDAIRRVGAWLTAD